MHKRLYKLLVTGAAGFIGSEFTRQAVKEGYRVTAVDKLTYAGDLARLEEVKRRISFYRVDIMNKEKIKKICANEKPKIFIHFAAESHVDRSILGSDEFIKTNVHGTQVLLDVAKDIGIERFIHISTDEVYGDILNGKFLEKAPLNPSSPYSASKAAADLLVKSYMRTFGFPGIIVRPSNNYGPWQYPEKFIPVVIYKAIKNEKIPVYGKGENIREWLHVSDCAQTILKVMENGKIDEIYNLGSGNEMKNIEVVKKILDILGKTHSLIELVKDRPGHDIRYSLNFTKLKKEFSWSHQVTFEEGIKETVSWYRQNLLWLERKADYLRNYWRRVYK